jgi:hypothetical protein
LLLASALSLSHPVAARTSSLSVSGVCAYSLEAPAFEMLPKAGILWIRTDVKFDRTLRDMYSIAEKYGLNFIGILDSATVGSNSSFTLYDWNQTVTKAQMTYPLIHVWEIWNEPTLRKFQLGYMDGTPQHYLDLLRSAYAILKARDSNSVILGLGGAQLGTNDLNFANEVFALGGGTFMDGISIHAYPYRLNRGQTWGYYKQLWTQELQQYKQLGKPVWITETGLESTTMTEADQATFLKDSYAFFQQQGVVAYFWYQWRDYSPAAGYWGLLRSDLTPRPSYAAYRRLLR